MNEKLSRKIHKIGFKFKKYSPEILAIGGTIGVVASAVMACKATTKANDILEETKQEVDKIHGLIENEKYADRYSEDDVKKDLSIVYVQTGVKFAKLYGPSIILGTLSLGALLTSNNILRKRNVALAAAYAAAEKGFKQYRSRVIERFGEQVDRELKNNLKFKEITVVEKDEDGNEKEVEKNAFVVNGPDDISPHARFFEEYTVDANGKSIKNPYWNKDNELNLLFLKTTEKWANDKLRLQGRLFLNDVYEMLGLPKTKAGQIVGWIYNEKNPVGDNYVDFGLYRDNLSYSDFVNGFDPAILLDFNPDGNIWDLM